MLWGQSAGAGSVDVHNFAFAEDPVVAGFVCDSGSAILTVDTRSTDAAGGNFSAAARGLGCVTEVPVDELDCMRVKPFEEIMEYLAGPSANLTFVPFIDDKVVFGNFTERLLRGAVSRKPAILGSNLNEGTALVGVDSPAVGAVTTRFQCQAPYLTPLRERLGLKTWKYQYRGNFSNVSPEPKLGAYYCAELPLVFGTSGEFRSQDTEFEGEVGRKMQELWVRLAEDSEAGLEGVWQNTASGKVLKIGEEEVGEEAGVDGVDDGCEEVYASFRG